MTVLSSIDLKAILAPEQRVTPHDLRACLAEPACVLTTDRGKAEYAMKGQGPLVMVSHGGPGGYDQGLVIGELFRKNGFSVLAPSRPGYLNTPLGQCRSAEEQGDFMASLLEAMDIPEIIMVGVSGGGPAAYQLAQRHPEKVSALVAIDAITTTYTKGDEINPVEEWMYLSKAGQWVLGFFFKHFPAQVVKGFLQTESSLDTHEIRWRTKEILNDENKYAFVDAMMKTMSSRFDERRVGAENDIALGKAIDRLPLDAIRCPVLIVHGTADDDVPPGDAEYAREAIEGARLLWMEKASHIGFWTGQDAFKVQRYVLDWLKGR